MIAADILGHVTPVIDAVVDAFGVAQGWLFQTIVNPLVYHLGFGEFTEEAFEGTEWLLIGLCELVLLFLVLRPLEALIPAQRSPIRAHAGTILSTPCCTASACFLSWSFSRSIR